MAICIRTSPCKHSVISDTIPPILLLCNSLFIQGSVPINCSLDYGDGHRQTDGTNREQYFTAHFSQDYTRYGQYNVSIRCFNALSANTTQITRTIRREKMNGKMVIYKNLMKTSDTTRFNLISREDYSFRHMNCLTLRNTITDQRMKLIWRKYLLEIIPTEVRRTQEDCVHALEFSFAHHSSLTAALF